MEVAFVYMLWATIPGRVPYFSSKFLLEHPKQTLHDGFTRPYHHEWHKINLTHTQKKRISPMNLSNLIRSGLWVVHVVIM